MTADLSCLKNVRLVLETIGHLGYEASKLKLVLNRSNAFTGHQRQERRGRPQAADRAPDRQRVPRRDQRPEHGRAVHVHEGATRCSAARAATSPGPSTRRPATGRRRPRPARWPGAAPRRRPAAAGGPAGPAVRISRAVSGAATVPAVLATLLVRHPPAASTAGRSGSRSTSPRGCPGFTIVGLPDAALSEARERVRGALRNAGFDHPPRRITVNLAPADLRKAGRVARPRDRHRRSCSGSEQLRPRRAAWALIGELGLGGEVRPRAGRPADGRRRSPRRGAGRVVVPAAAVAEARARRRGSSVVGVATLAEAADVLRGRRARGAPCPAPLPRRWSGRPR